MIDQDTIKRVEAVTKSPFTYETEDNPTERLLYWITGQGTVLSIKWDSEAEASSTGFAAHAFTDGIGLSEGIGDTILEALCDLVLKHYPKP